MYTYMYTYMIRTDTFITSLGSQICRWYFGATFSTKGSRERWLEGLKFRFSDEQWKKGPWLFFLEDEILPSCMGIKINQYHDPYWTTSMPRCCSIFLSASQHVSLTLPETSVFAPKNAWFEDDRFLLRPSLFLGAMLVSGRVYWKKQLPFCKDAQGHH